MRAQEILFNVPGQSWVFDVPDGRPDASPTPTVRVVMNANSDNSGLFELATTGTVAIDSVNTTLTTAALTGDQALSVATSTGMKRGRSYLIRAATGDSEWVDVLAVSTGACRLRRPLINGYDIGAAVVGTRLSIGVDPTWMADEGKITDVFGVPLRTARFVDDGAWGAAYVGYRARWSYSVDGAATVSASYGDLVRYTARNLITPQEVDTRFPGWIDRLPPDYRQDQGITLIDDAFYALKIHALADNQSLRRVRNTQVLGELTLYMANLLAVQANVLAGSATTMQADAAQKLYTQRHDQLLREPKEQVDQTGDGAANAGKRLPVWQR